MENTAIRRIIEFLTEALKSPFDPAEEGYKLAELNEEVLASAHHILESANDPNAAEFRRRSEPESWYVTLAAIPMERRLLQSLYRTSNFQGLLSEWWRNAAELAENGAWGPPSRRRPRLAPDSITRSEVVAERVFGYLGVLVLVLSTLDDTDSRRHQDLATRWRASSRGDIDAANKRQKICDEAVQNRFVRRAIIDMFAPPRTDPAKEETQHRNGVSAGRRPADDPGKWWTTKLDFGTLQFYKYGTTSVILRCDSGEQDDQELVLKCVLPAFASIADIAEATRTYAEIYGSSSEGATTPEALVKVIASWDRWILMKFEPGNTLEEFLYHTDNAPGVLGGRSGDADTATEDGGHLQPKPRLDLLELLIPPLLGALHSLAMAGLQHEDLSPSNVILQTNADGTLRFVLVDAGRNYVYSQSAAAVTLAQNRGSAYVAPESGEMTSRQDKVDVYSLGQLIIAICGVGRPADGSVPDAMFTYTPTLARFIEDLIEENPDRRLLLFGCNCLPTEDRYAWLRLCFARELNALLSAEGGSSSDWASWGEGYQRARRFLIMLGPSSGAPFRQRRLLRERRKQLKAEGETGLRNVFDGFGRITDKVGPVRHHDAKCDGTVTLQYSYQASKWLSAWSWISFAMWYLSLGVILYYLFVDVTSLASGSDASTITTGRFAAAAGYPEERFNGLCADIVGFAFTICGVKYYQNIYAGLTSIKCGRLPGSLQKKSIWAESIVRANAFLAGLIAVPIIVLWPAWWPAGGAVGLVNCYFVNRWGSEFTRSAINRARRNNFSTVPPAEREIAGLRMYESWAPSMAVYVLIVAIFAALIMANVLHDVVAYAVVVFIVNVGLLYFVKCAMKSEPVRIAITRSYLAAERLQRLGANEMERAKNVREALPEPAEA